MMADLDSTFHILPHKERTPSRDVVPSRVQVAPGVLAGEYVLKAVLASGGHGAVYEAEHRILGRRAALRIRREGAATVAEAQALAPCRATEVRALVAAVEDALFVAEVHHPTLAASPRPSTIPAFDPSDFGDSLIFRP